MTVSNATRVSNRLHSANASNFSSFDASVLATSVLTSFETKTLTYTIGTGAAADARTIVVTHSMSDTVTFTTMATVVGVPDEESQSTPSPTSTTSLVPARVAVGIPDMSSHPVASPTSAASLVPARVVVKILPEGTSTLTTEYQEHGTYTALTTVAPKSKASRVHAKRQVPTCANAVSAPAPTQTGVVLGCSRWHVAVPGETCATIATEYGILADTFTTWNPAVNPSCYNLLSGFAYCVARCGLSAEPTSAGAPGVYASSALSTSAPSVAVAGSYASAALPSSSTWRQSSYAAQSYGYSAKSYGYAAKSYPPKAPKAHKPTQMAKSPKPSHSAMAKAPGAFPSAMAPPNPFAFASLAWNGFAAGQSLPTPSLASNAKSPASSAKPIMPFMAPFSPSAASQKASGLDAPKLEVPSTSSSKLETPQNYTSTPVPYKTYKGNGSVAAGWPSMEQWVDFETMVHLPLNSNIAAY